MPFVEVIREDLELANELAEHVLGHSIDELSPPSKKLAQEIETLVQHRAAERGIPSEEVSFTRRELREWAGWSDFQVKTHIGELEDLEYLVVRQGRRGREYVYALGALRLDEGRFTLGLTPPSELEEPPSLPRELYPSPESEVPTGVSTGGSPRRERHLRRDPLGGSGRPVRG